MPEIKKKTRRAFIKDFGVMTGAAAIGIGGATVIAPDNGSAATEISQVPEALAVLHDPNLCRGCKMCEVACSAYHEGESSSHLSRIHIDNDDLNLEFSGLVCAQCISPSCYFACPKKDEALSIDAATGARYINEVECIGCGSCAKACPLTDPPVWQKTVNGSLKSFKCDLCKDREGGPLCVEVCPRKALTLGERGV